MTQTPLQQTIAFFDKNWTEEEVNKSAPLKAMYAELLSLLPKEREFLGEVWDLAIQYTEAKERYQRGLISIVNHNPDKNKDEFINQLYPKS